MTIINGASLLVFAITLAVGQVLFKSVGLSIRGQPFLESLAILMRLPTLYAALTLYGLATFLWIWILSRIPLAQAYPWMAVTIVLVPLLGWRIFGEAVGPLFWLGMGLVVVGVMLTQYASS